MKKLFALIVLAYSTFASGQAQAKWIYEDRGGQIGSYERQYEYLRQTGEHVVVDGSCLSACTLLLGILPKGQWCATARARFGFHAAWLPDEAGMPIPDRSGKPTTSVAGTKELQRVYPAKFRRWIHRHGGLTRHMIYLEGRDMQKLVTTCQ